jgi:rare lipoprotein A
VRRTALGLLLAGLAACTASPPAHQTGEARYLLGQPYEMGGVWSYPREDFVLSQTGLAVVLPDTRAGRRTPNGEVFDPGALMAAHRTLQLPAILSVWNLETGREIRVRVNDRGPTQPGRVVGLSRRAAELLGIAPGGTAQVRIMVEEGPSRALARALPGTEAASLAIAAAPSGAVESEALAPPPGARAADRVRQGAVRPVAMTVAATEAPPPDRLPEEVVQRFAMPGRLVAEAGSFFRRDAAQRQAARLAGLGARVEPFGAGRQQQFRVRLGPFAGVAEADRALAAVRSAGVPEVTLFVE